MKSSKFFLFLLFVSFLFPFRTETAPGDFVKDVKIPSLEFHFPKIQELGADPNTRILFLPNSEFPLKTLEISFYAGPSYFPEIECELSDILPETWKKGGTKAHPGQTFAEVWESYGSKMRVQADLDAITVTFSWLSRYDKESKTLIAEFLNQPHFGQEAFEISRLQLSEQIKRRNDNIAALAGRKAMELAYKGKIRGKFSSASGLEKLTSDAVFGYYLNYVSKARKSVLVTGDWKEDTVSAFLNEVLPAPGTGGKKESEPLPQSELEKNLKSVGYRNLVVDKGNTQNVVLFLGIGPAHNDPDFYPIQILNYIVGGGGFNSYFMSKIRSDKGLAYSSSSHPVFEKDHSLLFFMTQTKSQTALEVYDLMGEILSEKTFHRITEEELKNAKEAIQNKFIFLFTDSLEILRNEARFREHRMPTDYLRIYRDKIQAVTLEDIKRAGRTYFKREKLTAVISGPKAVVLQTLPSSKAIGPEDPIP
ncbi:insulinase family protein [Leptospira fluminis]|uniref:Insulinase family protein n=1 Tax=Leptospira fluminis TaxID=2484979 RepID=A0A4R9GP54_9LEPT|nr:pitrilysin family protein [Leptospira fluminis]TGK18747.1 insulinase family protein [Leptospira fluminis]